MKGKIQLWATVAFASVLAGCGGSGNDGSNNPPPAGEAFYAVRDNQLIRGNVNSTSQASVQAIAGLPGGVDILAIDVRPFNGDLIALGSDDRLYRIDVSTRIATVIGAGFTPAVSGTSVGFDFNPTVDRIRVVGNDGQNLRLNPETGVSAAVDVDLSDPNADIVAVAYTDNVVGASTTTLFAIDAQANTLRRIGGVGGNPSPNLGVLTTVGSLGVNVGSDVSFDISADGTAYMTSGNILYRVNLETGAATQIGTFAGGSVDGFAIAQ